MQKVWGKARVGEEKELGWVWPKPSQLTFFGAFLGHIGCPAARINLCSVLKPHVSHGLPTRMPAAAVGMHKLRQEKSIICK